jgi:hypothetical protein
MGQDLPSLPSWWSKDGAGPASLLNVFAQYMAEVEGLYRDKGLTVEADLCRETVTEANDLKKKFTAIGSQNSA